MQTFRNILAAAIIASVPLVAQPAGAAPLASSLVLKSTDTATVETVQWRRHGGGRWIGPAAGIAAGVAIAGALAAQPYYYSDYGYAGPGYAVVPAYPYGYGYYDGTPTGPNHPGCRRYSRQDNPMCQ